MNPPSFSPINSDMIRSKFHLARTVCIAFLSNYTFLNAGALDD